MNVHTRFIVFLLFCQIATGSEPPLSLIEVKDDHVSTVTAGHGECLITKDGNFLYVTHPSAECIMVYRRNKTDGKLTLLQSKYGNSNRHVMGGPQGMAISPDEKFLYVGGERSASITAFSRDKKTGRLSFANHVARGRDGVRGIAQPHSLRMSSDGLALYVTGLADDSLSIFSRDPDNGELSERQVFQRDRAIRSRLPISFVRSLDIDDAEKVDGLATPTSIGLSPRGDTIFVTAFSDESLASFGVEPSSGEVELQYVARETSPSTARMSMPQACTVSGDGRFVYVVSGGNFGELGVFRRESTGNLDSIQWLMDDRDGINGLKYPLDITIAPGGKSVYVASCGDGGISVFDRNAETGRLAFRFFASGPPSKESKRSTGPYCVTISPDNKHAYASWQDHSIVSFAIGQ